jgi:FdhD protein
MTNSVRSPVKRITPTSDTEATRCLPIEAPVAIEFNGIGYAVMMATPTDLDDFARGFAVTERIVQSVNEIDEIETLETPHGWLLKIQIAPHCAGPMVERVRVRVSESSCGLCGLENLEQVMLPLSPVLASVPIPSAAIFRALEALPARQPLNAGTGGVHAAAFCDPDGLILAVREDVGRHSALDKVIGAMIADQDPSGGFFLTTSRCSYELVEKMATIRCPTLVTISTATSLAVARAQSAGMRLIALARPDAVLDFGVSSL